jgi:hypothetical protein
MPTDYGTTISVVDDLPLRWTRISGQRVVAEAVARRWGTERGSLPYARDYGTDARGIVGDTLTVAEIASWQTALEREAEKDERVESASVTVTYDRGAAKVRIVGQITTADGEFEMVMSVSDSSAELLEVS